MHKETLGILGAAMLSAGLLGTPAAATPSVSGVAAAARAAAVNEKEDLDVRVRVRTGAFGDRSRVRVTVRDDDDPVRNLRVCLQVRRDGEFRTTGCGRTGRDGRVSWLVESDRTYRVRIRATEDYEAFRGRAFDADENADLRHD